MTIVAFVLWKKEVSVSGKERVVYLSKSWGHTTILDKAKPFGKAEAEHCCNVLLKDYGWQYERREIRKFSFNEY